MPHETQALRARMMLLVGGYSKQAICAACDLSAEQLVSLARAMPAGDPIPLADAHDLTSATPSKNKASGVYKLIRAGEFGRKVLVDGRYAVGRKGLIAYCRRELASGANPLARYMIFSGHKPELVSEATGLSDKRVAAILEELETAECGPDSKGPYRCVQAARVLGLSVRRVRAISKTGRLGRDIFSRYAITRASLKEFAAVWRLVAKLTLPKRRKSA